MVKQNIQLLLVLVLSVSGAWSNTVGAQSLNSTLTDWSKSVPTDRCISYSVECETSIQLLKFKVTSFKGSAFLTGVALYLPSATPAKIEKTAHSLCGSFDILVTPTNKFVYQKEKYQLVRTSDIELPIEVAVTPTDWLKSPQLGSLVQFGERLSDPLKYNVSSRLENELLVFEGHYLKSPEECKIQLGFDTSSKVLLLNELQFLGRTKSSGQELPCLELRQTWDSFSGVPVLMKREDWRYSSNEERSLPYRRATFFNYENADATSIPKQIADQELKIGTLVVTVRDGAVSRKYIGGELGEPEFYMRSTAFQLRVALSKFHLSK